MIRPSPSGPGLVGPRAVPAPGRARGPGSPLAAKEEPRGWAGLKRIYKDVDWSLSYVAFLLYFVIIITYRFSGASFVIAAAVGGLIFERDRRRFPSWLIWLGAFLFWGAVAVTQSPWPSVAWNEGVIEYGKLWLIVMVAANVLTNGPRLRFFLIFFIFLYATHPIRGALFNTFIYGYQLDSRAIWNRSWSNPNDMAALTFLPLGIAAGLLKDRSEWIRKAALAAVAVFPFVILLTRSRGAFLALAVFAAITVLANLKHVKMLVGLVVVGASIITFLPEGTFDRFSDFTRAVQGGDAAEADDSNSARQRLEIWRIAQQIIVENPVFGVGLAAYPWEHWIKARRSAQTEIGGGGRDAHSTYLRVIAEAGYPGLVLFMTPVLIVLARGRKARRLYGAVAPDKAEVLKYVEAGLIAYMVAAIFGSFSHTVFMWLHIAILSLMTEELVRVGAPARRSDPARGVRPRAFAYAGRPVGRPELPRPADARG